eukprot:6239251-Pyramimonas_sp.AAC.1
MEGLMAVSSPLQTATACSSYAIGSCFGNIPALLTRLALVAYGDHGQVGSHLFFLSQPRECACSSYAIGSCFGNIPALLTRLALVADGDHGQVRRRKVDSV